jgi:hypothetical protein
MAIAVIISGFGALNGWTMICAEMPLAAASDGLFPQRFKHISKKGVPAYGIVASTALASIAMIINRSSSGPSTPRKAADRLAEEEGWEFRQDGDSWRRVVPSPEPRRILEIQPDHLAARTGSRGHLRGRRKASRHVPGLGTGRAGGC